MLLQSSNRKREPSRTDCSVLIFQLNPFNRKHKLHLNNLEALWSRSVICRRLIRKYLLKIRILAIRRGRHSSNPNDVENKKTRKCRAEGFNLWSWGTSRHDLLGLWQITKTWISVSSETELLLPIIIKPTAHISEILRLRMVTSSLHCEGYIPYKMHQR